MRTLLTILIVLLAACDGESVGERIPDVVADTAAADLLVGRDAEIVDIPLGDTGSADSLGRPDIADDTVSDTPPNATNYVVVARDELSEAAQAFVDYRSTTGFLCELHTISELAGDDPSDDALLSAVRDTLREAREALDDEHPLFLLLVGDAPQLPSQPCTNPYGGCFTDNAYGDLDEDEIPEVAVGRLPSNDQEELLGYLAKLQSFEESYQVGVVNRRVGFFAGQPGFGEPIDSTLEDFIFRALRETDHAFDVLGGYAVPTSTYFYEPFEELVRSLFNDGALLVVYEGHGSKDGIEGLVQATELPQISCDVKAPHAFFYACLSGDYEGDAPGLAEELALMPGGPITVTASSDISHPYNNTILPYETLRVFLGERPATVGEGLLLTKVAMMENSDETRKLIEAAATLLGVEEAERDELRHVHLNLYNLMGDPGAAMRYPVTDVAFDPIEGSIEERSLRVSGASPGLAKGQAWITVETERDLVRGPLQPWDPENPDPDVVQANWAQAVDKVVAEAEVLVEGGRFDVTIPLPEQLPICSYWIKVYAHDEARDSFGAIAAP